MSNKVIEQWWKDYPASWQPMDEGLRARLKDAFYAGASGLFVSMLAGADDEAKFDSMMKSLKDEVMEAANSCQSRLEGLPPIEAYKAVLQ